jgi:hypothetical protein
MAITQVRRFEVRGLDKDSIPSYASYKNKASALKFADTLKSSEVYDKVLRRYIYGSSQFIKDLYPK